MQISATFVNNFHYSVKQWHTLYLIIQILTETRVEILSRIKAPMILQELLWGNSWVLGRPSCPKIPKDSRRFQMIPKDSKNIVKDSKRFPWPESSKLQAAGAQKANVSSLRIKELEAPAFLGAWKGTLAYERERLKLWVCCSRFAENWRVQSWKKS